MNTRFSEQAKILLNGSIEETLNLGFEYVEPEHLFLSFLKLKHPANEYLKRHHLNYQKFLDKCQRRKVDQILYLPAFTPIIIDIMDDVIMEAKNHQSIIEVSDLMIKILKLRTTKLNKLINSFNIDIKELLEVLKQDKGQQTIDFKYGTSLNAKAAQGKLHQVYNRDTEVSEIMIILNRKNKSNPLLIGEAGVGKTAIVEHLAYQIHKNNVPEALKGVTIINLDLSELVAGTKYRGDFEERLNSIVKQIKNNPRIILFIDEIHMILKAGGAEGAIDAANILKPYIARNDIRIIGATTIEEYQKFIMKDKALMRRFNTITIKEQDYNTNLTTLIRLKKSYEKHYHVHISDQIIKKLLDLSIELFPERKLPDKALDLIDECCSYLLHHFINEMVVDHTDYKLLLGIALEKKSKKRIKNKDIQQFIKHKKNLVSAFRTPNKIGFSI